MDIHKPVIYVPTSFKRHVPRQKDLVMSTALYAGALVTKPLTEKKS